MGRPGGAPENLKPFVKGADPRRNLKGRPKTLPSIEDALIKLLGSEDGDNTELDAILTALRAKAKKGDVRAAELVLNRAYGKPKETLDVNTVITETAMFKIGDQEIPFEKNK